MTNKSITVQQFSNQDKHLYFSTLSIKWMELMKSDCLTHRRRGFQRKKNSDRSRGILTAEPIMRDVTSPKHVQQHDLHVMREESC